MTITFGSRINRIAHLGLFSLFLVLLFSTVAFLPSLSLFTFLLVVSCFIGIVIIKIKRLHDFNFSGWWIFISLLPVIGWLFTVAIFLVSGTQGKNRFGDQPKPAGWGYKLMCLILPIAIIVMIGFNYFGISTKFENWKVYRTSDYSVELPGPYEVTHDTLDGGIAHENITYQKDKDKYPIEYVVDVLDYAKTSSDSSSSSAYAKGLKKVLAESLTMDPKVFIETVILTDGNAKNIQILSDQSVSNASIKQRVIVAKFWYDAERYVKAALYIDEVHRKNYYLAAFYFDNSKIAQDVHNADYFFEFF